MIKINTESKFVGVVLPRLSPFSLNDLLNYVHTQRASANLVTVTESMTAVIPIKVFIVEDSLVIRDSLIATLEELLPLKVVGVADDELGTLQWLLKPENECDLIIVDLFLRNGTGLGILRALHGKPKKYAVVVLSNFATIDTRQKCFGLGADRVFDKSNEIDGLIAYCKELSKY